jgi:hypothetical protein
MMRRRFLVEQDILNLVPLRDVATQAGATVPQVKYWVQLLGFSPTVRARIAYLTDDQATKIETMAHLVEGGQSPRDAAAQIAPEVLKPDAGNGADRIPDDRMIAPRIETLEKAIMLMVETHRQETAGLRAQVEKMSEQMQAMQHILERETAVTRALLAPPPPSDHPIIPWKPAEVRQDPLVGVGMIKRFWVSLVHPERLRRQPS